MTTISKISVEEYLAQEAVALYKSEYHAGEIIAMAGARLAHNQMVSNLIGELHYCLKNKNCSVLPSDILVQLLECDKFVYPDITIVCGKVELGERRFGVDVLLNPTVIIEVLSESTELYDRSDKFRCYKTLPSVQQYVLVDSNKISVDSYERTPDNFWLLKSEEDEEKEIRIGDCNILLKDIYRKVGFETPHKK
jgi:Uma2 family endonuclease